MGVIEGFTDVIVSDKTSEEKNELLKFMFLIIFIKFVLIYIAAVFLWPYVMPKLFSGVTKNPPFLHVLAFSIMVSFIF